MRDAIPQGIPGGPQTGHESTRMDPKVLLTSAGVLIGTIVVCQLGLAWWMGRFNRDEERVKALYPARQDIPVDRFPQPRLQERPPVDLVGILRDEKARVSTYGWVDKKAGVARIPVDRAIDILAEKGLPKVAAKPLTPGAPRNTSIPPAGKREEAGAVEKTDQPQPEAKGSGKP